MSKIKCRSCGKELFYNSISDIPTFPFCSERCKLTDLGSWFNEERRIEGPATNDKLEDNNEQLYVSLTITFPEEEWRHGNSKSP